MSHVVSIQTEVRDRTAVSAACRRLKLPDPVEESVPLFSEQVHGLAVRLPDWLFPVVCELSTGQLRYDNYGGKWGDPTHLNRFLQAYAVEKATLEASQQGHTVYEQSLENGAIKLTINVGGAA